MEIDTHEIDEMVNAVKWFAEKEIEKINVDTLDKKTYRRMRRYANMSVKRLKRQKLSKDDYRILSAVCSDIPHNLNWKLRQIRIRIKHSDTTKRVIKIAMPILVFLSTILAALIAQWLAGVLDI